MDSFVGALVVGGSVAFVGAMVVLTGDWVGLPELTSVGETVGLFLMMIVLVLH